jgi:hypothetical protein
MPIEHSEAAQGSVRFVAQFFYPSVELLAVPQADGPLLRWCILTSNIYPGLVKIYLLPAKLAPDKARKLLAAARHL